MIDVTVCSKKTRVWLSCLGIQDDVDLGLPKWIDERWWIDLYAHHHLLGEVVLHADGSIDPEHTTPIHDVLAQFHKSS